MIIFKLSKQKFVERDISSINNLLRQLNPNAPTLTTETLSKIFSEQPEVVIATFLDESNNNQIIAMASLYTTRTLFGLKGIIEDVVVDKAHRGRGLGRRLMVGLIDAAIEKGIKRIELTSQSSRVNANNLYKSLGFKKRETNVYKLEL